MRIVGLPYVPGCQDDPAGPDLGAVDELDPGRPARLDHDRATIESARTARFGRCESGGRYASTVVTRTPCRELIGIRPAPTEAGRVVVVDGREANGVERVAGRPRGSPTARARGSG